MFHSGLGYAFQPNGRKKRVLQLYFLNTNIAATFEYLKVIRHDRTTSSCAFVAVQIALGREHSLNVCLGSNKVALFEEHPLT